MTDKEIIIDGVDVAGCEFYFEDNGVIAPDGTPERANICTSPEKSCENNDSCYCNKDCYYKQLKRLEQENARIIEDNGKLFDKAIETRKENVALQDTLFSYRQILSKIKAIAEQEYNKKLVEKDCFDCDASFLLIIYLITKAESEG